jgi:hypothetical protein
MYEELRRNRILAWLERFGVFLFVMTCPQHCMSHCMQNVTGLMLSVQEKTASCYYKFWNRAPTSKAQSRRYNQWVNKLAELYDHANSQWLEQLDFPAPEWYGTKPHKIKLAASSRPGETINSRHVPSRGPRLRLVEDMHVM